MSRSKSKLIKNKYQDCRRQNKRNLKITHCKTTLKPIQHLGLVCLSIMLLCICRMFYQSSNTILRMK